MNYKQLANVEKEHWWHQSRLKLIEKTLGQLELGSDLQILDVGCGTGGTTHFLSRYGSVTGIDVGEALFYARQHSSRAKFIEADANQLTSNFSEASFDLVTFFGVLCHEWIKSDLDVLKQAMQLLKPGGYILITDAAYKFLRRQHDIQALATRRYRIADFKNYFSQIGLLFQSGRYFNAIGFPICLVLAIVNRLFPYQGLKNSDIVELRVPPPLINNLLKQLMQMEQCLYSWLSSPIGVSLLVIGQKPCVDKTP